jgi:hypothetical protein
MTLTADQKAALQHVYSQIAPDIPEDYEPEEIAELIIDANRLTLYGYPAVDEQMREFTRKDYGETLAMIVRELHL